MLTGISMLMVAPARVAIPDRPAMLESFAREISESAVWVAKVQDAVYLLGNINATTSPAIRDNNMIFPNSFLSSQRVRAKLMKSISVSGVFCGCVGIGKMRK